MSNLIANAAEFAHEAHAKPRAAFPHGQPRKYTGEPYSVHTKAVASTCACFGLSETAVAAAHLHDVLEDCDTTYPELLAAFGPKITAMVVALTDAPLTAGNRATRKQLDRDRISAADGEVQSIKCADLIDNTASIVDHDPEFAKTYLQEKEAILKLLVRADSDLLALAWGTLRAAQHKLVQDALRPPATIDSK